MRKIDKTVTLLLACTMLLASCGNRGGNGQGVTSNVQNSGGGQATALSTITQTTGQKTDWSGVPAKDIMEKLVSVGDVQIMMPEMMEITPEDAMYLQLGELDFEEGVLYIPMMSSQRFDMAVFRVREGEDAVQYAADLKKKNADIQWICAAPPDVVITEALGDVVLYLSINSELADADAIRAAFLDPGYVPEKTPASEIPADERTLLHWYEIVYSGNTELESIFGQPVKVDLDNDYEVEVYTGLKTGESLLEVYHADATISTMPFASTMLRVAEDADAEYLQKQILNGVDPQKWICASADKVVVVRYQNVIFMVMGDVATADAMADAFIAGCREDGNEVPKYERQVGSKKGT